MNELPASREITGPVQLQQIQRDLEWIKEKLRAAELRSTPNVRVTQTPEGTYLEIDPGATQAPPVKSVWRP